MYPLTPEKEMQSPKLWRLVKQVIEPEMILY